MNKDGVHSADERESDQRKRWAEHFQELFNREMPGVEVDPFERDELDISLSRAFVGSRS